MDEKIQSTKSQTNFKHQIPNEDRKQEGFEFWLLEFGVCLGLGTCDLEFERCISVITSEVLG
jgi:hypothetical protein